MGGMEECWSLWGWASWLLGGEGAASCGCSCSSCQDWTSHPDNPPQQGFIWPDHQCSSSLTCSVCFSLILQLLDMGRELPHTIALRPPGLPRNAERFWAFIIQCFFLTLSPGTTSWDEIMLWGHARPTAAYWVPCFSRRVLKEWGSTMESTSYTFKQFECFTTIAH